MRKTVRVFSGFEQVYLGYSSESNKFFSIKNSNVKRIASNSKMYTKQFYELLTNDKKKVEDLLLENSFNPLVYNFYDNSGNIVAGYNDYDEEYYTIKPYLFKKGSFNNFNKKEDKLLTLEHPYGNNLFTVLKNNKELLREVAALFQEYGYNLVIDFVTDQAEIQKNVDGVIYKVPFTLVADTLQRMIFHKCAIHSNKNTTLLLEEPENHSFPPYIKKLAHEIIDSETNQFFIATHSPYLFNTLISEAKAEEVAVHIVTFENFETKVKVLTAEEISTISNHGIDVFFNLNLFVE